MGCSYALLYFLSGLPLLAWQCVRAASTLWMTSMSLDEIEFIHNVDAAVTH